MTPPDAETLRAMGVCLLCLAAVAAFSVWRPGGDRPRRPSRAGRWFSVRRGERCACMSGRGHRSRHAAVKCARRAGAGGVVWCPVEAGAGEPADGVSG